MILLRGTSIVKQLPIPSEGRAVAFSPEGNEVAVGCVDMKIRFYTISGDDIVEAGEIEGHSKWKFSFFFFPPPLFLSFYV